MKKMAFENRKKDLSGRNEVIFLENFLELIDRDRSTKGILLQRVAHP